MNVKNLVLIFLIFLMLLIVIGYAQAYLAVGNPVLFGLGLPVFGAAGLTIGWYLLKKYVKD